MEPGAPSCGEAQFAGGRKGVGKFVKSVRLPFDGSSTALRPFYILFRAAALRRLAGYVTVTLMTFDKQSNGRRIEVES